MADDEDLAHVRERREALLEGITSLEAALAAPRSDARWRDRVGAAVESLRTTLEAHIASTEAADGFLARVRSDAPRLSNHVDRLVGEHEHLLADTVGLCQRLERAAVEPTAEEVDDVRERSIALLSALLRHRQRGSDLIYEAYQVDVGGPG